MGILRATCGLMCMLLASGSTLPALADDADAQGDAAGQELPSYVVPIEPAAAEAYWAPDSRHLIAQTRDPDAVPSSRGGPGSLTYIFTDDGKEIWRVNNRGQDACSYFFPDQKRVVWTSTRDHMDMPVGDWADSHNYKTDEWQEGAPFFMQDNQHIIFRAWKASEYKKIRPTPMTIFTINMDGTDWRRHTYDRGMNWHPHPAPDGRHYVYVKALTAGNWEIYLGDLAGDEHRRLTYADGIDILAAISPDGQKMNWGRAQGKGFGNFRTNIMDVSSLDVGPENYTPFDTSWGEPMPAEEN